MQVQDLGWIELVSILLTLTVLLLIRWWTARQTRLRAGSILFVIGLPAFLAARAVGATDAVQSQALIWPMILLPIGVLTLSLMLLVRGGIGLVRNRWQRRKLTRDARF